MEQLKVIGTEDDKLVLATESGERFSLAVDDVLRVELRKARQRTRRRRAGAARRARVRSRRTSAPGCRREEVAELLGARVEDVARFEGPVLAEREHVVGQALAVPVLLGGDLEGDAQPDVRLRRARKLAEAGAIGERWTSWKEPTGWIVKLEFTASDVDHDARWGFDPRRSTLSPLNADAIQLSRQGSLPEGLIPRLRALETVPAKDDSRFDSGAFGPRGLPDADLESPEIPAPAAPAVQEAAIKRASEPPSSPRPRRPTCSRRCAAAAVSASRCRGSTRSPRRSARRRPSRCSTRSSRATTRAPADEEPPASDFQAPTPAAVAEAGRVARGAPRCRRGTRSSSAPAPRTDPSAQANAPSRMSGTIRSSSVSDPCWPIIFCGALSARRSS